MGLLPFMVEAIALVLLVVAWQAMALSRLRMVRGLESSGVLMSLSLSELADLTKIGGESLRYLLSDR